MNALIRTAVVAVGGLVMAATPAAPQGGPSSERPAEVDRLAQDRPQRGGRQGPPQRTRPGQVDETVIRNVPLGAKGAFELSNAAAGDVAITGVEGNTIRIFAVKRVRHPDQAVARSILEKVTVRITERGGFVEVLTELPDRNTAPVFVDYRIALPVNTNVSLRTWGGPVRVTNIRGEFRIDAFAGDVTLSAVQRIRNAKAFTGNLTISDADGEDVTAETSIGTLQVRNVQARTLELTSVGGPILLADVQCDRCTMNSVGGDIEFAGALKPGGRYEMRSQSGNIRLIPTGPTGFDVEVQTLSGKIDTDFPLKQDAQSPRTGSRQLYGTYGDGAAIVSMRSFFGSVSIIRR